MSKRYQNLPTRANKRRLFKKGKVGSSQRPGLSPGGQPAATVGDVVRPGVRFAGPVRADRQAPRGRRGRAVTAVRDVVPEQHRQRASEH